MLKENLFTLRNLIGQIKTFARGCQVILDSGVPIEYLGRLFESVTTALMKLDEDVIKPRNYIAKYLETLDDPKSALSTELNKLLLSVDYLRDTLITAGETLLADPGKLVISHMEDNCIVDDALNIYIRQLYFVASRCHRVEASFPILLSLLATPSTVDQTTEKNHLSPGVYTLNPKPGMLYLLNTLNGLSGTKTS